MEAINMEIRELLASSFRTADNPMWEIPIYPFRVAESAAFDLEDVLSFFDGEPETEQEVRRPEPNLEFAVSLMPSVSTSGAVCAVCMEDFAHGTFGKRMPCSHVYHENCIILWFAEDGSCPLCRCRIPSQ